MMLNNNTKYKIFNVKHKINNKLIFTNPIPMSDIKILEEIYLCIKYVTEFLTKNNIQYCIMDGTLLGSVRHNGIIPWDGDFDIMIFKDGYDKLLTLIHLFNNDHFDIIHITPGFKIFYNKQPYGELFVYDLNTQNNKYMMAYPYVNNKPTFYTGYIYYNWQLYNKEDIFPLKKIYFENFYVYSPNNINNILRQTYNGNLYECRYDPNHTEQHKNANYDIYNIGTKIERCLRFPIIVYIYYIIHYIINLFLIKFK